MRVPDFLRTTTFRLAASFAVLFAVSVTFLFAFIYWQTALHETARIDRFLIKDAAVIARRDLPDIRQAVSQRNLGDLHRISYAALFAADGRLVAGNLSALPPDLPIDGRAHALAGAPPAAETVAVRAVARRLPGGEVLLVGRNVDAVQTLGEIVRGALAWGVIPALLLSIAIGAFASWRAQQRLQAVHRSAERILDGDLRERLPVRATDDDFDRLARNVNLVLDEIGRLIENVRRAGTDIAQDLRSPLAALRERLTRARESAPNESALIETIDRAIAELDRNLAVVTTLLRIGALEAGRSDTGLASFDLSALVDEVGQIYQPLAEDAGVLLIVTAAPGLSVRADRGLLLEAIANLVQNAIKFTPAGGHVDLTALATPEGPVVRVADTGPGIPASARSRIFERFFRADPSRIDDGSGLGLSLVAAIAKFHGFAVTVEDAASGSVFTLRCQSQPILALAG